MYKNLFEKIKRAYKKQHFSNLLQKNQSNIKETWKVMKEIMGKSRINSNNFHKKIIVDNKSIYNDDNIANKFYSYFADLKLAETIPESINTFQSFLKKADSYAQYFFH